MNKPVEPVSKVPSDLGSPLSVFTPPAPGVPCLPASWFKGLGLFLDIVPASPEAPARLGSLCQPLASLSTGVRFSGYLQDL